MTVSYIIELINLQEPRFWDSGTNQWSGLRMAEEFTTEEAAEAEISFIYDKALTEYPCKITKVYKP